MSKPCQTYREKLIDIYYNEDVMEDDLRAHMDTCQECKKYNEALYQMETLLDDTTTEVPIDYMNIAQAFEQAEVIQYKRKNIMSLILFIMVSGVILFIGTLMAIRGYTLEIIYFQAAMYFFLPIVLPVMIKMRALKEEYNE